MAFCFKRKERLPKAIRRLACARLAGAIECLEDSRSAEAIHCVRKDLKKTRAVLRIARSGIAKKDFRRVTKLLREAANCLAPARDAYVKSTTLSQLLPCFKKEIPAGSLGHVRANLRRTAAAEMKRLRRDNKVQTVVRSLRRAAKEADDLTIQGGGWNLLAPGLRESYDAGRCAFVRARAKGSPKLFHEWRKRAKDLWHQIGLLRPVWPQEMDAMARELERLGESLGDDHDLFVLQEFLQKECRRVIDPGVMKILQERIADRQEDLRAKATALGERFYTESPSRFCRRLERYWHVWRREKPNRLSARTAS